ncbi:chemotaxis protein CheW [Aetokthonos hydrillicola Thurmond2011]|jgi:chemotaxis-related protein WspD|uniref:Chemotaxis protein CheW n=1 Tax=Aetokthonos hydrillicola Thurmond2011 TaxID=2712845 RepID=A0AAP5I9K4_9CYAN|nr:chemotaxis protein CheW [Aetokthonos hydrillicola]MBO3458712.1 purine-binding chemotaxis protein CheW [Aetokthonos hydrillicola CCALA 1050]MBW4585462.1 chemotaxis protein CheW [Aetokthonos hydrillicola CCALA 1050]MDR9896082.1 chemotaxis protein CheW [Aetokthonos hydrillicola Thurmond2011]
MQQNIVNDCWNHIGVEGDRSCTELTTFIHCRNCPVYSAAGRSLLEREAPVEYLNEWTSILSKTQSEHSVSASQLSTTVLGLAQTISVMIFRLGGEWLALPVRLFQEVTQPCTIHSIPHRTNELFLGLVNIRGEILMCVSLSHLLDLETIADSTNHLSSVTPQRMVVVGTNEERWVFTVDEVCGIHRFHNQELQAAPVVISKATEAYTKGVIHWQDQKVNYLDSDLLFYTLNRRVL